MGDKAYGMTNFEVDYLFKFVLGLSGLNSAIDTLIINLNAALRHEFGFEKIRSHSCHKKYDNYLSLNKIEQEDGYIWYEKYGLINDDSIVYEVILDDEVLMGFTICLKEMEVSYHGKYIYINNDRTPQQSISNLIKHKKSIAVSF